MNVCSNHYIQHTRQTTRKQLISPKNKTNDKWKRCAHHHCLHGLSIQYAHTCMHAPLHSPYANNAREITSTRKVLLFIWWNELLLVWLSICLEHMFGIYFWAILSISVSILVSYSQICFFMRYDWLGSRSQRQ